MKLVQILLPLSDNDAKPFPEGVLRGIQRELCDRFGGLTAHNRAPAEGIWRTAGSRKKDDIVVLEVMDESFEPAWWRAFRKRTEELLRQEELVVRAHDTERL
jgi:hypothetical protein